MSSEFIFRLVGMILFGTLGVIIGTHLGDLAGDPPEYWAAIIGLVGVLVGLVLTPLISIRPIRAIRATLGQVSTRTLFSGIFGLIISLVISGLLSFPLSLLPEPFSQILPILVAILMSYFGIVVFVSRRNDLFSALNYLPGKLGDSGSGGLQGERIILLDTSVIIDGRIADIARTGFLAGVLMIPRFVLNELQYIADSGDNLRRQRGRRGLEVLSQLQKDPIIPVRISDIDVEGSTQVDDKLVILARQMHSPILTNDFNLNRVAELQGVSILNINELANAVKAVFLPGEVLKVRIIQEGREPGQGVGYLEDGTMVVVQDGNDFQGMEVEIVVTKILQTAAGRMIFARPDGEG
ncbi:MAG: TRAM domain-containing protein [Anaerolineae bacterium]|nr:TRAM domain-containing protein [Anaerolineae bacterium]